MKTDPNEKKILSRFGQFSQVQLLVIGDLMLDEFIWGNVDRISPEAPVPVVNVKRQSFMPGGAMNVAANISSLSAKVQIVGVVGDDIHGKLLIEAAQKQKINTESLIKSKSYQTTIKTRVIAHHQQVVRVDREEPLYLSKPQMNKILNKIHDQIKDIDGIIIEDYAKGLINQGLYDAIIDLGHKNQIFIAVDPKINSSLKVYGADVVTPNLSEALYFLGIKKNTYNFHQIGQMLLDLWDVPTVLLTLGEDGMIIANRGQSSIHIPTVAQEVYDVSGAGDTVIGSFCLGIAAGMDSYQAAWMANQAAGIVVGKLGTATVNKQELKEKIKNYGKK